MIGLEGDDNSPVTKYCGLNFGKMQYFHSKADLSGKMSGFYTTNVLTMVLVLFRTNEPKSHFANLGGNGVSIQSIHQKFDESMTVFYMPAELALGHALLGPLWCLIMRMADISTPLLQRQTTALLQ